MPHSNSEEWPKAWGPKSPKLKFEPRVFRAWGWAYFTALNRGATEISTEDLLVGLSDEFGKSLLPYFATPDALRALVGRIRESQIHHFGLLNPPVQLPKELPAPEPGKFVGSAGPGLPNSPELQIVKQAAEDALRLPAARPVLLLELMRALAQSSAAERLAKGYKLRFR